MAKKEKNQKVKKNRKPLVVTALIAFGVGLVGGLGSFLFGALALARDIIVTTVGIGTVSLAAQGGINAGKAVKEKEQNRKNKEEKTRTLEKTLELTEEKEMSKEASKTEEMITLPVHEKGPVAKVFNSIKASKKNDVSSRKK